jgi:hypothetical protein
MNKNLTWYIVAFVVGIAITLLFLKFCNNSVKPRKDNPLTRITDTLWRDRFYLDTTTPTIPVKPNVVTKYLHDYEAVDNQSKWKDINLDSIAVGDNQIFIVDSKGNHKWVTVDSLKKLYSDTIASSLPNWLVEGRFSQDSLSLIFFDGIQHTKKEWLMDYDKYKYLFRDGELGLIANPQNPTEPFIIGRDGLTNLAPKIPKFTTEANSYFSYNPFNKSARVAVDYSVLYKRFGLYTFIDFRTVQTTPVDFGVGVKVKLK